MEEKYKVVNGISYHKETSDEVINVLETTRKENTRIMVEYGDVKTGQGWGDIYDVTGTIGRSTGSNKIPLFIHNVNSTGGPSILDHCIVNIIATNGKKNLYSHPNYITGRK
jgi:hypothetical protein